MFANYLKVAFRNILKYKAFSFINVFGLAASMSICMLIILITVDQRGYDQFHRNKERIYRVETLSKNDADMHVASSALPLGELLRKNYPGIEASASLVKNIGGDLLYKDKIASGAGYFADGNLFRVMDFQLTQGDTRTALEKPFTIVIAAELAEQLFPHEDPIGKTITFNDTGLNPAGPESGNKEKAYGRFQITGVLKQNPGKTSLPFKLLASLSTLTTLTKDSILNYPPNDWDNVWSNYTYVLIKKGSNAAQLQDILDRVSASQYPKGKPDRFVFRAVALTNLMPADAIANPTNTAMPKPILLILGVLCLIVMLSACLNYTNLSVARQMTRAKEVGIRKAAGATRWQIFSQFITEAVLLSLLSMIVSLGLLLFFQNLFTGLWLNRFLNITFQYTPGLFLIFIAFGIAVGILAGLLPSIYMSLFNAAHILKGLNSFKFFKRLTVRRVLLVVQFSISLIFIVSTSLIYLQGDHVLNYDYGFDKDNVVNIKMLKAGNYDRFAQAIAGSRYVGAVSACAFPPATGDRDGTQIHKSANTKDSIQSYYIDIDAGCLKVWNMQLIAGRNLPAIPTEKDDHYVLINEKMVFDFHYSSAKQAVGQHLILSGKDVEIVGVVKDFQFMDAGRNIAPLMLRNRQNEFGYITVKLQGKNIPGALAFLQDTWKKVNPSSRFEFEFFDQQVAILHSMMSDTASILGLLAFLAVVISCLGLLGMAAYTAETRRKEIGIRKVLGSGVWQVILLLSKGFMVLLAIAVAISVPLAILINDLWLREFASRISITPWLLLANILVLAGLSFLIVLSQAWKVSVANPVGSLRME
jgi:putative ABC transport system permease protein